MNAAAIVLLNYNGVELLQNYLPQLIKHQHGYPIYMIDNGSTDTSINWVNKHHPEIECISLDKNYGFAAGYNLGLKKIKAEILILLNTDVWVTNNWITPVLEHFQNHQKTAIAQPHLLDFKKKDYFEYAGAAGGFIDQYGYPYCRGRIFDVIEKDDGQYDQEAKIFWASGACFFIRKRVFDQLNGFDPDFFAHQEEIDLCWRARQKGYNVYAIGSSKVFHLGGGTLKPSPKKVFLNHRNSLYMLLKNLPSGQLFKVLFIRLLLDGLAGIKYFLEGQWKNTLAILKAHFAFYKNSKHFLNKRPKNIHNYHYFVHKTIVKQFFLWRIRNFNQLKSK